MHSAYSLTIFMKYKLIITPSDFLSHGYNRIHSFLSLQYTFLPFSFGVQSSFSTSYLIHQVNSSTCIPLTPAFGSGWHYASAPQRMHVPHRTCLHKSLSHTGIYIYMHRGASLLFLSCYV